MTYWWIVINSMSITFLCTTSHSWISYLLQLVNTKMAIKLSAPLYFQIETLQKLVCSVSDCPHASVIPFVSKTYSSALTLANLASMNSSSNQGRIINKLSSTNIQTAPRLFTLYICACVSICICMYVYILCVNTKKTDR